MKHFICFTAFLFVCNTYCQPGLGFSYTHREIEQEEDDIDNEYTIQYVFKKSPAEKAGLKAGDKIVKFHDALLVFVNTIAMANIIKDSPATVNLIISRNGVKQNFTIKKADKSTYLNICLEGNCNNGTGSFVDMNGTTYSGTFKNNKKEGKGKAVAFNGDTYEGQWKNDKREGFGTFTSPFSISNVLSSGWSYKGEWKEDTMNGKGRMDYTTGGYFEGNMLNNNRSGYGKVVLSDNTIYEGTFKDNTLNGNGTMQLPNGDKRTGNFVNGKLEGEVTVYSKATGETVTAIFIKGIQK